MQLKGHVRSNARLVGHLAQVPGKWLMADRYFQHCVCVHECVWVGVYS